jgi:hypothetical protein
MTKDRARQEMEQLVSEFSESKSDALIRQGNAMKTRADGLGVTVEQLQNLEFVYEDILYNTVAGLPTETVPEDALLQNVAKTARDYAEKYIVFVKKLRNSLRWTDEKSIDWELSNARKCLCIMTENGIVETTGFAISSRTFGTVFVSKEMNFLLEPSSKFELAMLGVVGMFGTTTIATDAFQHPHMKWALGQIGYTDDPEFREMFMAMPTGKCSEELIKCQS